MPFTLVKIPEDYVCSITHEIMVDPVFTADGDTYERKAIADWLTSHDTNPNTGSKLEHKQLTLNKALKSQISKFVEDHRRLFELELPRAAEQGDFEMVELILQLGIKVDAQDANCWTALYHAVNKNHEDIIKLLLNAKANINQASAIFNFVPDAKYAQAINERLQQLQQEQKELNQKLLDFDIKQEIDCYRNLETESRKLQANINQAQHNVYTINSKQRQIAEIRGLDQQIADRRQYLRWDARETRDNDEYLNDFYKKRNLLAQNFINQDLNKVLQDLEKAESIAKNEVKTAELLTPQLKWLEKCIEAKHVDIITKLFRAELVEPNSSFDIQAINALLEKKWGKLENRDLAALKNKIATIQEKIAQAEHDLLICQSQQFSQCTPLLFVAYNGNLSICKLLIPENNVSAIVDSNQSTLLHWAARGGHEPLIKTLLIYNNLAINAPDQQGNSAIDIARAYGFTECVKLLEKESPDKTSAFETKSQFQSLREEIRTLQLQIQLLTHKSYLENSSINNNDNNKLTNYKNIAFTTNLAQISATDDQSNTPTPKALSQEQSAEFKKHK